MRTVSTYFELLFVSETTLMSPHKNNFFLGRHDGWLAHSPANELTTGTDFWLWWLGICRAIAHPNWDSVSRPKTNTVTTTTPNWKRKPECDVKEAVFIIYCLLWEMAWTCASSCEEKHTFCTAGLLTVVILKSRCQNLLPEQLTNKSFIWGYLRRWKLLTCPQEYMSESG